MITPPVFREVRGPWLRPLEAAGFEIRYPGPPDFGRGPSEQEVIQRFQGVAAVISGGDRFTRGALAALPELRVIARAGVGYDWVDVGACTDHGVALTITPTANHESVAEAALAFVFATAKELLARDAGTRTGSWPSKPTGPIRGRTLGILGLGRIGRSVATRARALAMRVIATESFPDLEFTRRNEVELVSFDELLAQSDYLTIHCPLNDSTRGMFNADVLSRMKPESVLINTARGGLMVEADLVAALRNGPLRAAGLDVFEREPAAADNPLFQLDNVVVSPHVGGVDTLSAENMALEAADSIVKLARNEWPEGSVVNNELRANWRWEA
jgi:phosphoglycerate dehydrogenase-like enzyme